MTARLISLTTAMLIISATVFAAVTPLPAYRQKLHDAKQSLDILIYSDVEETNRAENARAESLLLGRVRAALPPRETVEWQGLRVEVENEWLLAKLKAYEEEKNSSRRKAILIEISERLDALEAKARELEAATSSGERSKDENKQKLAEILRRAEYQKPEPKKENALQKAWHDFWNWLDGVFPRPKMGEPSKDSFQSVSSVMQIVLFTVVLGIIGFLLYRFAPFLRERFKRRVKTERGARVVLGETLAADATSASLFSEAEKLAREGNLRAAIRKGYIATLCELSDRKIIGLARHKTNRDYLRDVRNLAELHGNMRGLTGSYERHWYGFAAAEEKDWEEFRQKYRQTVGSGQ